MYTLTFVRCGEFDKGHRCQVEVGLQVSVQKWASDRLHRDNNKKVQAKVLLVLGNMVGSELQVERGGEDEKLG